MNYVSFATIIFNINSIIWSETFLSGEKGNKCYGPVPRVKQVGGGGGAVGK